MEYLISGLFTVASAIFMAWINYRNYLKHIDAAKRRGDKPTIFKGTVGEMVGRGWLIILAAFIQSIIAWSGGNGNILHGIFALLYHGGIFSLVFNASINKFMRKKWSEIFYVSVTNGKWWDSIFKGKYILQFLFWLAFIAAGVVLTLIFK